MKVNKRSLDLLGVVEVECKLRLFFGGRRLTVLKSTMNEFLGEPLKKASNQSRLEEIRRI